eukprot:8925808-Pyramimonas_sp.AAC.1
MYIEQEEFTRLWAPVPMDKQQVFETFRVVREAAVFNELGPIQADGAHAAAAKMSARAGLGVDIFTPVDFQRLPRMAISEMASILQSIESTFAWLIQLMMALCRLIPKKRTGDRAIGILTVVARFWSLHRGPPVRSWPSQHIASWDAAVEGNPSLREAYLRAIDEEMAHTMNMNFGHAIID